MQRVARKFLEDSSCSRAKQWQRNVQKKCAARAKFYLLIRPTDFSGCFCCRRRLALHNLSFLV